MQTTAIRRAEGFALAADDLHREANNLLQDAHGAVFASLPVVIRDIIDRKVWKSRAKQFKNFGEYALDQSVDGLCVDSNQKLWILRCAMDVHDTHIAEWADVLAKVEEVVRVYAKEEGISIKHFDGNSLEKLAKNSHTVVGANRVTYLPSTQFSHDGHLIRLRKNDPKAFKQVVTGKVKIADILREKKAPGVRQNDVLAYLRYQWNRASNSERTEFLAWLRAEGHLP